jgi:hypothetical protein
MAKYVKLVAKGGKRWIAYWLHPDEPADRTWHLIELDTEFTFWGLLGLSLTEGSAAEQARYRDQPDERIAFTQLAANSRNLTYRWAPRTTTPLMTLSTRWTRGSSWRSWSKPNVRSEVFVDASAPGAATGGVAILATVGHKISRPSVEWAMRRHGLPQHIDYWACTES